MNQETARLVARQLAASPEKVALIEQRLLASADEADNPALSPDGLRIDVRQVASPAPDHKPAATARPMAGTPAPAAPVDPDRGWTPVESLNAALQLLR